MKIQIFTPPLSPDFSAIVPVLYEGLALQIKQNQAFATEHLVAGFLLCTENGAPLARAALYQNPDLRLEGQPCLALGAYECVADAAASKALLGAVIDHAKRHFPDQRIVGPMDGSTWQAYRFVTAGAEKAPFLLEPFGLPHYPAQWLDFGFEPLMEYHSQLAHFDESDRVDFSALQQKFEGNGLVFRNLNLNDTDGELWRLARFNLSAFQEAFLFTSISEEDFVEKNRRTLAFLKPELVHLALEGDTICGLIFAYPDLLDPTGKTAVVKTLARLPGEHLRGLGELLCAKIVASLLDLGYQRMIHALMRKGNASLGNSARFWGEPYKSYTLFQLPATQ
jgi:hypothetical protein